MKHRPNAFHTPTFILTHNARIQRYFSLGLLAVACVFSPFNAQAKEQTQHTGKGKQSLVILTPFPRIITQTYRKAFKKKYPNIDITIIRKKTGASVKHLQEQRENNIVDLFWASSVDAFQQLKGDGLLLPYLPESRSIPKTIQNLNISDSGNAYTGYALSGYGYMWNTHYLQAKNLPPPENWSALANKVYYDHIGLCTPARSGTTHIAMESILQNHGWENGWQLILQIAANAKTLTERSFDVPKSVRDGEFGIGIVIDYYGFLTQALNYPVEFAYPSPVSLLPASAAVVNDAPNKKLAENFIDFLVSTEGQYLLLDNNIRRLPVLPSTYASAPDNYPNPFKSKNIADIEPYDIELSVLRYQLLNALFNNLVTFNFETLKQATRSMHELETQLIRQPNIQAQNLLAQARSLIYQIPVSAFDAESSEFVERFRKERKNKDDHVSGQQFEIEKAWENAAKERYLQAESLAQQGLRLINTEN